MTVGGGAFWLFNYKPPNAHVPPAIMDTAKKIGIDVDLSGEGAKLPAGMNAEQVSAVLQSEVLGLRHCYETEIQKTKAHDGQVILQWDATTKGVILKVDAVTKDFSAGFTGCVSRTVDGLQMPPAQGKAAFPVLFRTL